LNKRWLESYFDRYKQGLFETDVMKELIELKNSLIRVNEEGKKILIFGNGGSAAIAGHAAVDLSKNAKIRTVSFNDPALITCLANDYSYSKWMAKAIELYGDEGDIAVLVSSSGRSPNVVCAAKAAKANNIKVVTFTGFDIDNPLKQEGELNFWLNSCAYNIVENVHQIWLLAVCDAIIGEAEYAAN